VPPKVGTLTINALFTPASITTAVKASTPSAPKKMRFSSVENFVSAREKRPSSGTVKRLSKTFFKDERIFFTTKIVSDFSGAYYRAIRISTNAESAKRIATTIET